MINCKRILIIKLNKMKIELDKEDIKKEIDDNYRNDSDFLFEIVDNSTTNWDVIRELTTKLLNALKENRELNGIADEYIE